MGQKISLECSTCEWGRTTTTYGAPLRRGFFRCAHPATKEARPLVAPPEDWAVLPAWRVIGLVTGEWRNPDFRWPWEFRPALFKRCEGYRPAAGAVPEKERAEAAVRSQRMPASRRIAETDT